MALDEKETLHENEQLNEQNADGQHSGEQGKQQPLEEPPADSAVLKLEQELEQTKDTLLRTAAEYDNFRKRSQRERDAAFGNGVAFAVEKLLGVIDTLELAANAETADEAYKKGVMMTLNQAKSAFQALGIEEIEAMGQMFDPQCHAAVMQQEAAEGVESGTVLAVLQRGYRREGRVLRHASVAVAQ